jgi:hypothetical protein
LGDICIYPVDTHDAGGDAPACAGSAGFACILGGCSNDIGTAAVCTNGIWNCPTNSIPTTSCGGCTGNPPPGWVCGDGGWTHVDAGHD